MAAKDLIVKLVLKAKDEATGAVGRFKEALGGVTKVVASVGAAIASYFSVKTVVNFFSEAIGSSRSFEAQMKTVQAVSGATAEQMQRLEQAASDMGAKTRYTATEAAQALEALARAGLDADQAIEALPSVLALAQGNSLQLGQAASYVTQTIKGMGLEISDAGRVADVLSKAAASANTNVEGLGLAMSYVAPVASAAGMELETTVALIGKLADAGLDGSRAGTALKTVLSQLADPTSTFSRELAAAGITTTDFTAVLEQLEAAGPRAEQAINAVGLEAGPALRALLNQGSGSIRDLITNLQNAEGAAAAAAETMDNSLDGALLDLGSAWDALQRRLVKPLMEPITARVRELTDAVRGATDSGLLDRLGKQIADAFTRGTEHLKQFIAAFDIEAAATKAVEWFGKVADGVRFMGRAFDAVAGTVQVVWNAVYQSVAVVMAYMTKAAQGVMWVVAEVAAGMGRLGMVSQQTVNDLRISVAALGHTADAIADESVRAYEAMLAGAERLTQALAGGTDQVAASAKAATTSTADLINELAAAERALDDLVAAGADVGQIEAAMRRVATLQEQVAATAEASADKQVAATERVVAAAETQADATAAARADYERTLAAYREGAATADEVTAAWTRWQRQQRATTSSAAGDAKALSTAYQILNIDSTESLRALADEAKRNYEVIARSAETSASDKKRAFLAAAETIIKANDGEIDSWLRQQAAALGLTAELEKMAGAADALSPRLQRLAAEHERTAAAASKEADAVKAAGDAAVQAARIALESAKARGDENEIRRASVQLAAAEVAAAEDYALAKANEAHAAWEKVRALEAEAAADGVLTAAEEEVLAKAREVAEAKDQEAEAAARAADEKSAAAEATEAETKSMQQFVQVSGTVRQKYADLSDAAAAYFDKKMAGVQTIREWWTVLSDREFERVRGQFEGLSETAQDFVDRLADGEATTYDLEHAQQFLTSQTEQAKGAATALGDEQLEPLRDAIRDAQRRMQDLHDEAADMLTSLQDELLDLQGREDELAQRRMERRRAELEARLAEARASGDRDLIRQYEEALRVLEQIAREEEKQRQAEAKEREERERSRVRQQLTERLMRARQDGDAAAEQMALDALSKLDRTSSRTSSQTPRGTGGTREGNAIPIRTVRMDLTLGGRQVQFDVLPGQEDAIERLFRELEHGRLRWQ